MKGFLLIGLPLLMISVFVSYMSYQQGALDKHREEREAREKDRCYCGQTRSCTFGPGIVGIQECDQIDYHWRRCEPNAQYCDDACLHLKVDAYNHALAKQADLLNSKP